MHHRVLSRTFIDAVVAKKRTKHNKRLLLVAERKVLKFG